MRPILSLITAIVLCVCIASGAETQNGTATMEDAVALTKRAVAFYNSQGAEAAYAEFNKPTGQFRDRDLYIFVYNQQGVVQSIGSDPKLIGRNLIDLQDADGKKMIKGIVDIAFHGPGKGWFDYRWQHPVSKAIEVKSSYVERVDNVLIGCGIYKLAIPD